MGSTVFRCFGSVMETLIALIDLMRLTALRSKYRNVKHNITRFSFLLGNYSKLIGPVKLVVLEPPLCVVACRAGTYVTWREAVMLTVLYFVVS